MFVLAEGLSRRIGLALRSRIGQKLTAVAGSLACALVMVQPVMAAPAPAEQIDEFPEARPGSKRHLQQPIAIPEARPGSKRHLQRPLALPEARPGSKRRLQQPFALPEARPGSKRHLQHPLARIDEPSEQRVSSRGRRPLQLIEQAVFLSPEPSVVAASSPLKMPAGSEQAARMVEEEAPLRSARPLVSRAAQPISAAPEEVTAQPAPGESVPLEDDFRPLSAGRTDIRTVEGEMPTDHAREQFGNDQPIIGGSCEDQRQLGMVYAWEAAALCHGPLYFEDVNLERYGYSFGILQPAVSFAHFFGTVPKLPYMAGAYPPHECIYTLGYYRPGSCVPYQKSYLPFCSMAALLEAEAITAFILLIP